VLGVDDSFFAPDVPPAGFQDGAAWLSRPVAEALGVGAGDRVALRLQKPGDVPRESSLGKKDAPLVDWELKVAGVLGDDEPGAAFSLRPSVAQARNILVALPALQKQLEAPGQANALLAAGPGEALTKALEEHLTLDDWGLLVRTPMSRARNLVRRYDRTAKGLLRFSDWVQNSAPGKTGVYLPRYAWVIEEGTRPANPKIRTVADLADYYLRHHPYLALVSNQLLLTSDVADAALRAARETGLRAAPTLVYLCRIQAGDRRIAGVVAALDAAQPPPLGPFLPPGRTSLGSQDIALLDYDWKAGPRPDPGSPVELIFKPPETHGPAADVRARFRLAGYLPAQGPAADPGLTPDFPGITDREDLGAWELPFDDPEWTKNIGREYGDLYWKRYRATPKAYINLARGKELWASRFGELTSIRLALVRTPDPRLGAREFQRAAARYREALLKKLNPAAGGFVFEPVRSEGLQASQGGTPFDLLFLGFSSFLILSALLLVGLLLRLNLDRRSQQAGLFFAEGFPYWVVRQLFLEEGMILALIGTFLGLAAALGYSRLLVDFLAWLWPGGALRSLLRPHVSAWSLGWGALGMIVVSAATVWWVVRILGRVPPRALLAGQTTDEGAQGLVAPPARWSRWLVIGAALGGAILLVMGFWMPGQEAQAGTFFSSGLLFLTAGLAAVRMWMRRDRAGLVEGLGTWSIARLGVRNAGRHPTRSLLAMGLLAAAAFLIVAVESFRRRAEAGTGNIHAADGGFALLAESDLPLYRDLNTEPGRREVVEHLPAGEREAARKLLEETEFYAFRVRAGDDASCLNLYQPRSPQVIGVPKKLIERGGFVFDSTLAASRDEKANPWLILTRTEGIPAFGESNTVTWMLKTAPGKKVNVPNEKGEPTALTIAGTLDDSVFQSSLLVSEDNFKRLYPRHEGYNFFLIAPPRGREEEVRRILEKGLADRGFEVTTTRQRLEEYLAVISTYLSTFQALGGLGLVLGSLGLAVVLLRAVWERRGELALLRALGYRRSALAWLVLAENSFLLLAGLAVGTVAALLSILPQLVRGAGSVPWAHLALLFAGVLLVALTAGALATAGTLRAPIVPALRRE
jgi:ABC-type antimicrobial peptide transport system permease subunit